MNNFGSIEHTIEVEMQSLDLDGLRELVDYLKEEVEGIEELIAEQDEAQYGGVLPGSPWS